MPRSPNTFSDIVARYFLLKVKEIDHVNDGWITPIYLRDISNNNYWFYISLNNIKKFHIEIDDCIGVLVRPFVPVKKNDIQFLSLLEVQKNLGSVNHRKNIRE